MDDMSVFRRFFVISDLIREIMSQGGIRQPSFGSTEPSPMPDNGYVEENRDIPPHIGGGQVPITGTRPTRSTRRTRREQSSTPPTDRYKFPS